jgi:hypothetical protein
MKLESNTRDKILPIILGRIDLLKKKQNIVTVELVTKIVGMELDFNGDPYDEDDVNRLVHDVEYYAKRILTETEKEVGWMYPADEKGNKPVAYYWARTAKCSNPSCGAEIPMLRQFYLANTSNKKVYLKPIINGKTIQFEIEEGSYSHLEGWNNRGTITCPCCGNTTNVNIVKEQSKKSGLTPRLLAVIYDTDRGKVYKLPTKNV